MHLGRALAEAEQADEVRALAATSLGDADENRILEPYLLAFVDLHDAKLGRAIPRLEEAGNVGMLDLLAVADVAGRTARSRRSGRRDYHPSPTTGSA